MRTPRFQSGSTAKRPYWHDSQIESICTDELRKLDLLPSTPSPIRIDRFVEKCFSITPEYDELPEGILGLTRFGANGVQGMTIARQLDEEGTSIAERRIRTTLAHEAGHGLFHARLFVGASQANSLFGDFSDPSVPKVLCRDVPNASASFRPGYDGRWWEYQANRAIGPLLMPRQLVQLAIDHLLEAAGSFGLPVLNEPRRSEAILVVAKTFDVNPIVARIRLQELHPPSSSAQLRL